MEAIRTRFAAWRSIDPAMNSVSMFVGSDIDPDGVTWTQYEMPAKVVATRICTLAKAVTKVVQEQGPELDVSQLFIPALEPYDFIIHLSTKLQQNRSTAVAKFKNLKTSNDPTRAGKDTVVKAFVRDLQACFSPNIIFFSGNEQSEVIGGLWNPVTLKPKSWSLGLAYSTVPADATVSINRGAMLNEISRLGLGVVSSIEVQKE
jgi:U3 small nucleolar RNA-associated protein 22